jgi:molybdenum ABC transporter molybdate-binding protein
VQGFAGAAVAALATFLPCYLFTIIPAPYFKKHGRKPGIVAFVDGVTAAAIGTIAGAVVVLGQRSIADVPTLVLALATATLLAKTKKIPEPAIVLIAALAGLVIFPFTKGHANMQTNSVAAAAEIRVYSGGAPRVAVKRLAPEFERSSGHKLALTFDGVAPLRQRLAAGEKADVILLPVPMLAAMDEAGALRPGSRIALARSALGVVVREGAALPDVSNPEAVRKALLAARSIAYSDPKLAPSGVHLQRVFAQMGIADALKPKSTLRTPFDGGVELVAKGEAEIGVYLVSEIQMVQGVRLAGLLPTELQDYAVYAGAVAKDSAVPEPALAFLKFLSDPARREHWTAAGFQPVEGAN